MLLDSETRRKCETSIEIVGTFVRSKGKGSQEGNEGKGGEGIFAPRPDVL